ncbi:MAG: leucine-rich repeat domain-containing protein [Clostridia bacterium]|nr:leucine-rich repeat domain-containing protein [Clostridia bacterium]
MKKTALKIITCVFLTALSLFVFTACNKGGGSHDHVFSTYVSDNNATFESDGTKTAVCDVDGCNETDTVIDVGSKLDATKIFKYNGSVITGLTDYGSELSRIIIPNQINGTTITSIGENAFSNCGLLTSVEIPKSVTNIGNAAFLGCKWLTNIEMPNNVTSIGDRAFYLCYSLTSIEIPNSVKSIGKEAFAFCSSLTSVNYTGTIDEWAQIEFSDSASNPLCYNKDLYINGELVTDANLTTATKISDYAFYDCSSITSVKISNSVTSIGNYAFYDCDSLTSVTIGNGVTSIGSYAFYGCIRLVEVVNKSNLDIQKGSSNYGDVGYYALTIHKGESKIVKVKDYLFLTVDGVNYLVNYMGNDIELKLLENYNGRDYVIYDYAFYDCSSLTSIEIPNSVTSIGSSAFRSCSLLTSVTIGSGVTSIGNYAFYGCSSLTSIEIPNSVTSIGTSAFENCDSLISVTIGSGVTSIGSSAFYDCDSLTSIEIPDSVTSIGSSAFKDCSSLTSIEIPNSVTSIGSSVFLGCSSLTTIKFNGTKAEWGNISKGYYWNYDVPATKVICSDGELEI